MAPESFLPTTASHSAPVIRSRIEVRTMNSPDRRLLGKQHLFHQVVDDVPVGAGKAGDELAAIRAVAPSDNAAK